MKHSLEAMEKTEFNALSKKPKVRFRMYRMTLS